MADIMLLYSSEEFALSQGAPPLSITTGYILYYLNPSGLVPPPPFLCGLWTVYQGPAVCWLEATVADRLN